MHIISGCKTMCALHIINTMVYKKMKLLLILLQMSYKLKWQLISFYKVYLEKFVEVL